MVSTNAAGVKLTRRRKRSAAELGFDPDVSFNESDRPLVQMPAGTTAVIGLWSDTHSRAEGRGLASGGDTFAEPRKPNHSPTYSSSTKTEESDCKATEESDSNETVEVSETRRRYDLKHAVVRMLRNGLREDERSHSVCGCGFAATDLEFGGKRPEVTVHRNGQNRAWVSGVYRCKSGWLCPTCAPAVARQRQQSVQTVVEKTTGKKGVFLMGLVTVSHTKKDRLSKVKKMVAESFAAARRQKNWAAAEKAAGIAGVLVAPEVTYGRNGWHFHIHFGLPCLPTWDTTAELTPEEKKAAEESMLEAAEHAGKILIDNFRRQVAKRGGRTIEEGQGVQIAATGEAAADYIAKGVSWELTGGTAHKDEVKGLTIWQIVEDADIGDIDSFALFLEYSEVMPGTRSCVITQKLKDNLGLFGDVEDDDDESGTQNFDNDGAVVGRLRSDFWHRFLKTKLAGTFLSRIEAVDDKGKPNIFETVFDEIVDETLKEADKAEGIMTLKRAAKIQKSAADEATGHAATQIMLTRNVARRIRSAQALGKVHEVIAHHIETLRNEGHPEAALPTPSGIVAEIARLDREAREREAAQAA